METNNPLLKLKEKREQIHTPKITSPFNTDTEIKAVSTEETINKSDSIITKPQKPQKKSENIKYNLIINSDVLFTLKALANYRNKPINETLNEALKKYYDINNEETIKAKEIYNQLLKLKGGK